MKKYLSLILISGVVLSIILNSFLNQETSDSIPLKLNEATFFDPLCKDQQIFTIDYRPLCTPHTQQRSESVGASANIDDVHDRYQIHLKTFFLKINLDELPRSEILNEINIVEAKLTLKTARYEDTVDPELAIYNGFCPATSWNMSTPIESLPCIGEGKLINMIMADFSEYKKITDLTTIEIEIKKHIESALEQNLNGFTELIQFYPLQFKTYPEFTPEQRFCLYNNVTYTYDIEKCIKENRVGVYSIEHPTEGLQPSLVINYKIIPTDLGRLLNSIIAFIPAMSTVAYTILKEHSSKK